MKSDFCRMREQLIAIENGFADRLASLRLARGISGREMSLSLGQGAGYINNIENGRNLPSMTMFFRICEYLEIAPDEFFSYAGRALPEEQAQLRALKALTGEERELVEKLIGVFSKNKTRETGE